VSEALKAARLATCEGIDVDLFVADFGLVRTPAVYATGNVVMSRFGTNYPALIPVGTTVLSNDGSLSFTVIADTANALFSADLQGYTVGLGVASASVPVTATQGGAAYNVQAGTLSLVASSIPGIDGVTNPTAFGNGRDAESDDALKARFVQYIAGLSKATLAAVGAEIAGVQAGLTYSIFPNSDPHGNFLPGNFVVTVDDGSGNPPRALLDSVYAAVDQVRALAETFSVQGPTIVQVTISMTISVSAGVDKPTAQLLVANAIRNYVDNLAVGAALSFNIISKIAFDVLPTGQISDVSQLLVNSQFGDAATVNPGQSGVVRVAQVVVN
jgi:phage-related baseplate assembly protein